MQTNWTLPLKITSRPFETEFLGEIQEIEMFHVVTAMGNPVGHRLLKGTLPPAIENWGPFTEREDAEKLMARLERHFKDWPKERKRYK